MGRRPTADLKICMGQNSGIAGQCTVRLVHPGSRLLGTQASQPPATGQCCPAASVAGGTMRRVAVYRDTAVVLRVTKLGEADRIVTLLTRRTGTGAGGREGRASHQEPVRRPAGAVQSRRPAALRGPQPRHRHPGRDARPLRSGAGRDYSRYTCATAIAETAERLTAEEREPAMRLYLLVVSALRALTEQGRDPSLVLDAFLLRAMALAGWAPALRECARCGEPGPHAAFSRAVRRGCSARTAGAPDRSAARPAAATVQLMVALADGDWPTAQASPAPARREASGLVAALLQWHLERGLRSLTLVDRGSTRITAEAPPEVPSQQRGDATGYAPAGGGPIAGRDAVAT